MFLGLRNIDKMKQYKIKNDSVLRRMFRIRGIKSKNTIDTYITAFVLFLEFTGLSPSKVLEIAQSEYDNGIKPHMMTHFELIGSFREQLENSTTKRNSSYAPSTIKCYVSRIQSFFATYYLPVPSTIRSVEVRARTRKENQKLPNRELILKAIEVASIRDRAIILVGVSSGLAASDICNLTVQDFKDGYDPITEITTLSLRRQKTHVDFTTFLSPEASRAVNLYLLTREPVHADTLENKLLNNAIKLTPESPLFIRMKHFDEYLSSNKESDRALKAKSIVSNIYPAISKKVEEPVTFGDYCLIRSHNMRKYFSTTLRNSGVDGDVIEHMMGHTLGAVKQAYVKFDPEFLKKVYMENYLALLIDERADASTSPEFKALKEENKELSNQNEANRSLAYQYKGRAAELEEKNEELTKSYETQNKLMDAFMSDPSIRDLMSKIMEQTEAKEE
jgi:integrase